MIREVAGPTARHMFQSSGELAASAFGIRGNTSDELRRQMYFIRNSPHILGYCRENCRSRFICGNPWLLVWSLGRRHAVWLGIPTPQRGWFCADFFMVDFTAGGPRIGWWDPYLVPILSTWLKQSTVLVCFLHTRYDRRP